MSICPEVESLVEQISGVLAGNRPEVVGCALADLLALWLASHISEGGAGKTDRLRERLLEAHIEIVRKLIPVNEAIALERLRRRSH